MTIKCRAQKTCGSIKTYLLQYASTKNLKNMHWKYALWNLYKILICFSVLKSVHGLNKSIKREKQRTNYNRLWSLSLRIADGWADTNNNYYLLLRYLKNLTNFRPTRVFRHFADSPIWFHKNSKHVDIKVTRKNLINTTIPSLNNFNVINL